jgi:hypothetical protein
MARRVLQRRFLGDALRHHAKIFERTETALKPFSWCVRVKRYVHLTDPQSMVLVAHHFHLYVGINIHGHFLALHAEDQACGEAVADRRGEDARGSAHCRVQARS